MLFLFLLALFNAVLFLHVTNGDWIPSIPEYPACPGKPLFKESTVYYWHASPAEIPIHEGKDADRYSQLLFTSFTPGKAGDANPVHVKPNAEHSLNNCDSNLHVFSRIWKKNLVLVLEFMLSKL